MDGWEHGSPTSLWTSNYAAGGTASVVSASTHDMTGTYCLSLGGELYTNVSKTLSSTYTEMYFSFLSKNTEGNHYMSDAFNFYSNGVRLATLGDTGSWLFVTSGATPIAYSTTPLIDHYSTHHYSGYFKLADSGGRWVVYVDGKLAIDFTGDTKPDSNTTFNQVVLGYGGSSRNHKYFDDFIIDTTTLPLRPKAAILVPTGVGNSTQWTSSVSTPNWECLNEIPASDTDYVWTLSVNTIDTYNLSDLPSDVSAINTIQVYGRAKKKDILLTNPSKIGLVIRTNSTDYVSSDKVLTTSFSYLTESWSTNPSSTGVAWDATAVNSMQIGIKSLS
jgi:hypothetical protein